MILQLSPWFERLSWEPRYWKVNFCVVSFQTMYVLQTRNLELDQKISKKQLLNITTVCDDDQGILQTSNTFVVNPQNVKMVSTIITYFCSVFLLCNTLFCSLETGTVSTGLPATCLGHGAIPRLQLCNKKSSGTSRRVCTSTRQRFASTWYAFGIFVCDDCLLQLQLFSAGYHRRSYVRISSPAIS